MSEDHGSRHWPLEIRYDSDSRTLEVDFDNGVTFAYTAEYLRVESPSAEVQGHAPAEKQIVAGRKHVGIMAVEPVGNYAVRIRFDDMHDTGIYSWAYLYRLGEEKEQIWQRYLEALEQQGLSREPPRRR